MRTWWCSPRGWAKRAAESASLSLEGLECLGIQVDSVRNQALCEEGDISPAELKVRVLVIPTHEELMLARAVTKLLSEVPQEQESL